jgi:hypothetical protein
MSLRVKYWEIIADNLSKAGFSRGCVSAIHSNGRTIWIADAHRGDGRRFVVHADEKLTAFLELETAIRGRIGAVLGGQIIMRNFIIFSLKNGSGSPKPLAN